jgi:hypothetical protein
MKLILENWRNFIRSQNRISAREKKRKLLSEISSVSAQDVNDWFENDYSKLSFGKMFNDKLRYSYPLQTEDQGYLEEVTEHLRKAGWAVPEDEDDARWEARSFQTKTVKQKMRKLDTGEEYEVDVEVPDLKLERTVERTIPKGPRAGEIIRQKEVVNFAKAMEKSGVPQPLMQWWQRAQGMYTKDGNWAAIEDAINSGEKTEGLSVIMSRHPIDVLRMSDIGSINSCHSEGNSYFQCAVAEAKGHGPIAYLVKTDDLKELLRVKDPDEEIYGNDYDTMQGAESVEKPTHHNDISDLDDHEIFRDSQRGIKGISAQARVRLRRFRIDQASGQWRGSPGDEYQEEPEVDFGTEVAVPEIHTYGRHPAGFVRAVNKEAWERQKEHFTRADGSYEFPEQSELTFTGGSYSDTHNLGSLLNKFFSIGSGQNVTEYGYGMETDHGDEQANVWDMWEAEIEEHNNRAGNELKHASFHSSLEDGGFDDAPYVMASGHLSISIPLTWEGAKDKGGGSIGTIKQVIKGKEIWVEDEGLSAIPETWADWQSARDLRDLLQSPSDASDVEWRITKGTETAWDLDVELEYNCEDCGNPDEVGGFLDWLKSDIDDKHDEILEAIRRELINNAFMRNSAYDNIVDEERTREREPGTTPRFKNFVSSGFGEFKKQQWESEARWHEDHDGVIEFKLSTHGPLFPGSESTAYWISTGIEFPVVLARDQYSITPVYSKKALVRAGLVQGSAMPGFEDKDHIDFGLASSTAEGAITRNLIGLEKEAHEMISRQLHLELGDGWEPKVFSGMSDTNRAKIVFGFHDVRDSKKITGTRKNIGFNFKVEIRSVDSEKDLQATLEYIQFLDDHVDEIMNAIISGVHEVLEPRMKFARKEEQEYSDGTTAREIIKRIYRSNAGIANDSPAAQGRVKIAKWVADNWQTMNDDEKRVAINHYLIPIDNRSLSDPDTGSNLSTGFSGQRPPTPPHFSGYLPVGHREWAGTDYHDVELPSWAPEQDIEQGRGLGRMFENTRKPKRLLRIKFKGNLLK